MSEAAVVNPNVARSETVLHLQQAFKLALSLVLFYWLALTLAVAILVGGTTLATRVYRDSPSGHLDRAEQAMDALKKMSSPDARVVRSGEVVLVPAAEVVPGDVLLLEQGDIVTADMRLVEAPGLKINEAPLTGESEPVAKVTEPLPDVGAATPADQRNMAFSGTAVTLGRARGLVVSTGMATAIGRIAAISSTPTSSLRTTTVSHSRHRKYRARLWTKLS